MIICALTGIYARFESYLQTQLSGAGGNKATATCFVEWSRFSGYRPASELGMYFLRSNGRCYSWQLCLSMGQNPRTEARSTEVGLATLSVGN